MVKIMVQTYFPREQVIHHTLLDFACFGELGFEAGNFSVHVGEDGGDDFLLGYRRKRHLVIFHHIPVRARHMRAIGRIRNFDDAINLYKLK